MTIGFNRIPSNLRVPFVAVEIDSSKAQAGPAVLALRALLIGQKTADGTATADTLYRVQNPEQVRTLAGAGSILHRMAIAWFANNRFAEVWMGVLADNGGGTAATGSLAFTGPTTAGGTLHLYVGGVYVPVAITAGMSADDVADAVEAAIDERDDLAVIASIDSSEPDEVQLAFKHKGLVGNSYDVRVNYQDGEATPAGLGVTITALSGGASNPTLDTLIAALGDNWYHVWVHPYTDATSLDDLEDELERRDGPLVMIDAVAFTAADAALGTLAALGDARNSRFSVIAGIDAMPTPPMERAAAIAAQVTQAAQADPARPFQTLPLLGVRPPVEAARFTLGERNSLLFDGVSTTKTQGGREQIDRLITTYQLNAAGGADDAYLSVNTPMTLMYLRYSFRSRWTSRYPRHKLASDGTKVAPGQAVVTPSLAKQEIIGWMREMEAKGLIERVEESIEELLVERDDSDVNRLNARVVVNLVNQLNVTAAQFQFRL